MIPLDDIILVRIEDKEKSLVNLPDWQRVLKGTIVSAGPGKLLPNGKRTQMSCKAGDYVTFAATAGIDSSYKGAAVRIMKDVDVDAVLS